MIAGIHINIKPERIFLSSDQTCVQCGRCCEKWGWGQKGVIEDLVPWIQADRQDILQHVFITLNGKRRCNGTNISQKDLPDVTRIDYWVDLNGRPLTHCPFFTRATDGKVYCGIHGTKPKVCIGFMPWNEGIRDYALNCPACRNPAP
jgi:Fe-S-cluster containining protein